MVEPPRVVSLEPLHVHVKTIPRKISLIGTNLKETQMELDSHADTCALGRDALIINDYCRPVQVSGYDPALGTQTCKTVSGVVAWTRPSDGRVFHLIFHQALHLETLDHHLICPMQCRE